MTGEQDNENRSSKPEIGMEVWGSSRPLTKVRGAKWIPIGFGKDDLHPQRPTGWKLVKIEKKPKNKRRSSYNTNESTTRPLPRIERYGKEWWGNYNADLTDPDKDK